MGVYGVTKSSRVWEIVAFTEECRTTFFFFFKLADQIHGVTFI
jgi:hypothetical protein